MNQIQTLDESVCISLFTDALEKGVHLSLLLPTIGKLLGILGSLTLVRQPVLEKEKPWNQYLRVLFKTICGILFHYSSVISLSKKCGLFYTNLSYYKQSA